MDKLFDIIKDTNFWTGSIIGIALFKLFEKLFANTYNRLSLIAKYFFNTKRILEIITLNNIPPDMVKYMKPGFILSRFGNDEFLKDTAIEKEKMEMGLQNKITYLKYEYLSTHKKLNVELKINIHKKFGTQFKLFMDFDNYEHLLKAKSILEEQSILKNIGKSESLKNRLYFLIEEYKVVKTSEGIENNFIFPE